MAGVFGNAAMGAAGRVEATGAVGSRRTVPGWAATAAGPVCGDMIRKGGIPRAATAGTGAVRADAAAANPWVDATAGAGAVGAAGFDAVGAGVVGAGVVGAGVVGAGTTGDAAGERTPADGAVAATTGDEEEPASGGADRAADAGTTLSELPTAAATAVFAAGISADLDVAGADAFAAAIAGTLP